MTHSLLTAVSILLAIGAIYWRYRSWQKEQRARDDLVAFALAKGWDLLAPDPALVLRWPGEPFRGGTNPRCGVVLGGTFRSRTFTAFEYMHDKVTTDSNGRQRRRTERFTVCVLGLPGYLPVIHVDPESNADRALGALGWGQDQEFESEDFNRAFRVRSDRPKEASDVLSPRTMQLLVSRPAFAWRTQGPDLVTWVSGILDPMGLLARLDTMSAIIDGVPSFVWHDRGGGQASGAGTVGPVPTTTPPTTSDTATSWEAKP